MNHTLTATAAAVLMDGRATQVNWPVDADELALAFPEFTPSAGNLWAQPGVNWDSNKLSHNADILGL